MTRTELVGDLEAAVDTHGLAVNRTDLLGKFAGPGGAIALGAIEPSIITGGGNIEHGAHEMHVEEVAVLMDVVELHCGVPPSRAAK